MTDRNEGEASYISPALRSYIEDVFRRVPLRPEYKRDLQDELETHLEEAQDELLDLGYKPYAAEERIIRRLEPPDVLADQYNRMESLRSWFRDHLCVRAVALVAAGYIAVSAAVEFLILLVGLSGLDTQIAYTMDTHMVDVRQIAALLAGPLAYWLYYRWSGNTHRLTPFATLSIVSFIAVSVFECNLNFISPFPNPECRVFFVADFPLLFSHVPFIAGSCIAYEFELSGISINFLKDGFHAVTSLPYLPDAPIVATIHYLGLALAVSFLLERFKQRQFFQTA